LNIPVAIGSQEPSSPGQQIDNNRAEADTPTTLPSPAVSCQAGTPRSSTLEESGQDSPQQQQQQQVAAVPRPCGPTMTPQQAAMAAYKEEKRKLHKVRTID
jgi:hypothetical protein